MAEHFLVSIDIKNLPSEDNGLDLRTISYLHRVHITVTPETQRDAVAFLRKNFNLYTIYCDCTALGSLEDILSLLNNGGAKVFVAYWQMKAIVEDSLLVGQDLGRLVVSFDNSISNDESEDTATNVLGKIKAFISDTPIGIQIQGVHDWKLLDTIKWTSKIDCRPGRYVNLAHNIQNEYINAVKDGHVAIIPADELTTDPRKYPDLVPAHTLITSAIRSDRPDGLFPTIVTDENGVSLGLVYSSEKSIEVALQTGRGVYHSRRHGLWIKGQESGDTQDLINISMDCDTDALQFNVRQGGKGFCHLKTSTCFGPYSGVSRLERTLRNRKASAPADSYTSRLFNDPKLLKAKIMEEASELCEATDKKDVAAEAGDLFYFALTKCIAAGVSMEDIEHNLDMKSTKITRRKGDAKPQWAQKVGFQEKSNGSIGAVNRSAAQETLKEAASIPKEKNDYAGFQDGRIRMKRYKTRDVDVKIIKDALQRPSQRSTDDIMDIVKPIIKEVREGGDAAVLKYTHKFEEATSLTSPILRAPFPQYLMQLPQVTIEAINVSYENIRRFHAAQGEEKPLRVETMPGVVCSRFSRPIERVGLYVPGGTAVLPSTALMLGVPAMVAGCKKIIMASPPRKDGTITPEIVYIAHKIGAESIVLAGGAQAVAALAYGTESISKVDKILGPGNQFVTTGKMVVSNDTTAGVSIDMPAGPSEVLVIADKDANPKFVASDLLSQAEHGIDSQVILIAVDLSEKQLGAIEDELHAQAMALPRKDIVRGAIDHSVTLVVKDIKEAMEYSNQYAPEHLILQVENAESVLSSVENAGSVFVGPWAPESVGDYSAGTNHSLPTYGYAKQYSGVNLSSFTKHITSSNLTQQGLRNVSSAVMQLAKVEELEAHWRAVSIRLQEMNKIKE
ncbi:MAG: trifunctional histidinol dehydrogenase [Alectoria fallacina]|uniref:Histidine biosynthesis trifunctional protein n=1 Tax=Alectoria fallacina TaxID=1903189 RepID=A0A8H3FNK0_9LECA|nr:MAG: trifunctional histidinol dehydrogenase [Alectoria fallacina]